MLLPTMNVPLTRASDRWTILQHQFYILVESLLQQQKCFTEAAPAFQSLAFSDNVCGWNSDKIGRFIALWATFQRLWQSLFRPPFWEILFKVSKCFIFRVKSFLGNFYRLWRLFTGHTGLGVGVGVVEKKEKMFHNLSPAQVFLVHLHSFFLSFFLCVVLFSVAAPQHIELFKNK